MIRDMIERELLQYAPLMLAQRGDTPPARGDLLADTEGEAFNERRVDLPASGREDLRYRLDGFEDHAMAPADQAPSAPSCDHLCREELRQRQPTRLGHGAFCLLARQVDPHTRQDKRGFPLMTCRYAAMGTPSCSLASR
jgi:hypothetical protein